MGFISRSRQVCAPLGHTLVERWNQRLLNKDYNILHSYLLPLQSDFSNRRIYAKLEIHFLYFHVIVSTEIETMSECVFILSRPLNDAATQYLHNLLGDKKLKI